MTLLAAAARRRTSAARMIDSTGQLALDWNNAATLTTYADLPAGYLSIREQDDIVYDPDEADPSRRWKLYYSAQRPGAAGSGDSHIFVIFSADRVTWSTPVQCTLGGVALVGEDPSITQNISTHTAHRTSGGLMVMYLEVGIDVDALTSVDGIAWTTAQAAVVARGTGWDSALAGSPCARHDGTFYIVAYEGINGSVESSGIAYGADPAVLAKSGSNPFLTAADFGYGNASAFIDSMWLAGDYIHITGHAGYNGAITMFRAYTTNLDPTTWQLGDFTLIGMVDAVRNDLTCDWWGDRLITQPADDLSLVAVPLVTP